MVLSITDVKKHDFKRDVCFILATNTSVSHNALQSLSFLYSTQKSTHTDLGALYDYHTVFTQRHQLSAPLTPSKAASPHPVGMETDKKEERNQTLFFLLDILLTVITVTVFKNMNIDPYVVYYLLHGRQNIICLRIFF